MSGQLKEWFSAAELAGLPDMPGTPRRVRAKADRESYKYRDRQGRGGGREYHISSLPSKTRSAIAARIVNEQSHKAAEIEKAATETALTKAAVADAVEYAVDLARIEETRRLEIAKAKEAGLKLFLTLPEWKRRRAQIKAAILKICTAFLRAGQHPVVTGQALFVAELAMGRVELPPGAGEVLGEPPSLALGSLQRWFRLEREQGIFGLVDHYGTKRNSGAIDRDGRLQSIVLGLMESNPFIRPGRILEFLQAKYPDLAVVGERTISRFMTRWKTEHRAEWEMMSNPDKFKNHTKVRAGDADENIVRLNQLWEMDSTPADVMLTDGRHSVLGVIDIYSRRMMLLVSKTSKATMVAALLRRALMAWGVPEAIRTDNGKDYQSKHLTRIISDLGIEQVFCAPFASEEKPFIERGLGTFSHDLVPLLPGFIGHNVADRKAIEAKHSFAERIEKGDKIIEVKMSSTEFQKFCTDWAAKRYAMRVHESLNMSPFKKAAQYTGEIRRINDPRALDMLLMEDGVTRQVGTKGIRLDNGLFLDAHGILGAYVHRNVFVLRDPENMGSICVYLQEADGSRSFLCWAFDPDRFGIPRKVYAEKMEAIQKRIIKRHKEEQRQTINELKKLPVGEVIMQADREASAQILAFPAPAVEHTSPALQQAAEAANEIGMVERPAETIRIVEAAAQAEPSPETERKVAKIISIESRRQSDADDEEREKETRFQKYLELRARNFQGLDAREAFWVKSYPESIEFKVRWRRYEEAQAEAAGQN